MLYWYLKVFYELILTGDNVKQFVRDPFGVAVECAYPFDTVDLAKFGKKFSKLWFSVEVFAVESSILSYHYKFGHAVFSEETCLFENVLHGNAAEFSSYHRYSAVGTAV